MFYIRPFCSGICTLDELGDERAHVTVNENYKQENTYSCTNFLEFYAIYLYPTRQSLAPLRQTNFSFGVIYRVRDSRLSEDAVQKY